MIMNALSSKGLQTYNRLVQFLQDEKERHTERVEAEQQFFNEIVIPAFKKMVEAAEDAGIIPNGGPTLLTQHGSAYHYVLQLLDEIQIEVRLVGTQLEMSVGGCGSCAIISDFTIREHTFEEVFGLLTMNYIALRESNSDARARRHRSSQIH